MSLTPLDIHNKEFGRGFRGYNEAEVDEFLDQVVRDYEGLIKENAALRERVEELNKQIEQYRQMEDTLHDTLIVAQETAEEVRASSNKEAELVVREAQQRANDIIQEAREQVRESHHAYRDVVKKIRMLQARAQGLFQSSIELLEGDDLLEGLPHPDELPEPPEERPETASGGEGGELDAAATEGSQGRPAVNRDQPAPAAAAVEDADEPEGGSASGPR